MFLPALARSAAMDDIEKNRRPKGAKTMSGAKGSVIWRATAAMFALALLSAPGRPKNGISTSTIPYPRLRPSKA
jgi:hypothetical protein